MNNERAGARLTNPRAERVRKVAALARRAVRTREGLFLAEGPQAVREAVAYRPELVREVYVDPQRCPQLHQAAAEAGLAVYEAAPEVLSAMCDTQAPQGIIAVCEPVDVSLESVLPSAGYVAVLAQVRDPGNAGTVLRGADAAGADAVIFTDSSVDVYNPKVVRSTVGSLFHVPVVVGVELDSVLAQCRAAGVRLLAADGAGDRVLRDSPLQGRHAWVFGNEAWGLPQQVRAQCDEVVRVPIYGQAESLNLAMAATLCLYASADAHHR
ncbi:TrmH family RNA methyltransferase [Gephyromycinifex aptenodytis]|uniref:TrmH family RNA methyltransferase n=1 Tax=Gephyromycinifex aptenodytis TaxID=2716227 RepID=UPI001444DA44|nr:RNA methyltransferase [Gephyromycinifex aptenodytis]